MSESALYGGVGEKIQRPLKGIYARLLGGAVYEYPESPSMAGFTELRALAPGMNPEPAWVYSRDIPIPSPL